MVRADWLNLNGLWEYDAPADLTSPFRQKTRGTILVPYPIESALSGVMQRTERLWYRRTFTLPAEHGRGNESLLHFGAVDWEATVYVNGKQVGTHRGGYDPFSFDITDALNAKGPQEIIVGVFDPSDEGEQPRGKQVRKPRGIWYTPVHGDLADRLVRTGPYIPHHRSRDRPQPRCEDVSP